MPISPRPSLFAQTAGPRIHPAVVRVIVQDKSGRSHGSGSLVAVTELFGLVLTNWHVVRDAAAPPMVVFPDGFQSAATIARVDRDWDLAALIIWRPRAEPIPLAATPPRPGDPLAIAGYGKGQYRVARGRCTQYLSPGTRHPFELVELTASARQGDSGGPILNERGELAGVLFGSAFGRTTGSHSGRVRQFLGPLWNDFHRLPEADTMIAARPQGVSGNGDRHPISGVNTRPNTHDREASPHFQTGSHPNPPVAAIQPIRPIGPAATPRVPPGNAATMAAPPSDTGVVAAGSGQQFEPYDSLGRQPAESVPATCAVGNARCPSADDSVEFWEGSTHLGPTDMAPPELPSRSEQLKTILAAIGILAMVFHGVRLLGRAVEV